MHFVCGVSRLNKRTGQVEKSIIVDAAISGRKGKTVEKITLNVEGMSCSHCENRVKKAVGALAGVKSVDVSLKGKTVAVELDPSAVSEDKIKEAIEDQGYQVV